VAALAQLLERCVDPSEGDSSWFSERGPLTGQVVRNAVLGAMRGHPGESTVQHHGCRALAALTHCQHADGPLLASQWQGAWQRIQAALDRHRRPSPLGMLRCHHPHDGDGGERRGPRARGCPAGGGRQPAGLPRGGGRAVPLWQSAARRGPGWWAALFDHLSDHLSQWEPPYAGQEDYVTKESRVAHGAWTCCCYQLRWGALASV
jgi:hypothetical protein